MTPDYIDPTLAISLALILVGVYIIVRLVQSQERHRVQMVQLAQVQRAIAMTAAVQMWGTDPRGWPAEIRDALGVSL